MGAKIRHTAIKQKGWLKAYQWLLLRRLSQILFFMAFTLYAFWGIALVEGSLTSSRWLGLIPATESFTFFQSLLVNPRGGFDLWFGGLLLLIIGVVFGSRLFCGWVCPVNITSDAAHWLKNKIGIKGEVNIKAETRYALLLFVFIASFFGQFVAWESLSPISNTYRSLLFAGLGGLWFIGIIFLLDILILRNSFCQSLCPQGALYHLIGQRRIFGIKVTPSRCTSCGDCYKICPEEKILHAPLRSSKEKDFVQSGLCTGCGQCIDVCCEKVLTYGFIEKEGKKK